MELSRKDAATVKKLTAQLTELRDQIDAIQAPYRQRSAETMVGLCFKTRNNYSCPEKPSDYWWRYVKVQSASEHGHLNCLMFEVDRDGNVSVRKNEFYQQHSLSSYSTISPDEFQREFAKMLKHAEKMNG